MERLKDGNIKLCRLFVVSKITKQTIKENKKIKVKKNVQKISD